MATQALTCSLKQRKKIEAQWLMTWIDRRDQFLDGQVLVERRLPGHIKSCESCTEAPRHSVLVYIECQHNNRQSKKKHKRSRDKKFGTERRVRREELLRRVCLEEVWEPLRIGANASFDVATNTPMVSASSALYGGCAFKMNYDVHDPAILGRSRGNRDESMGMLSLSLQCGLKAIRAWTVVIYLRSD